MTESKTSYYVTAREGNRVALCAGPFLTRAAAEGHVRSVAEFVRLHLGHDALATFAAIGVAKVAARGRVGKLNAHVLSEPFRRHVEAAV